MITVWVVVMVNYNIDTRTIVLTKTEDSMYLTAEGCLSKAQSMQRRYEENEIKGIVGYSCVSLTFPEE